MSTRPASSRGRGLPDRDQEPRRGFDLGSAVGQSGLTASFLDVDVNSDPTRQGFEAQAREDRTGFTGIWRLATYAICAS